MADTMSTSGSGSPAFILTRQARSVALSSPALNPDLELHPDKKGQLETARALVNKGIAVAAGLIDRYPASILSKLVTVNTAPVTARRSDGVARQPGNAHTPASITIVPSMLQDGGSRTNTPIGPQPNDATVSSEQTDDGTLSTFTTAPSSQHFPPTGAIIVRLR